MVLEPRGLQFDHTRTNRLEKIIDDDAPILPSDLDLDQLLETRGGNKLVSTQVPWRGKNIDIEFKTSTEEDLGYQLVLKVDGYDNSTGDDLFNKLFRFSGHYIERKGKKPVWEMNYRMVETMHRRKGYGELAGRLWVEAIEELNEVSPNLKADRIEVPTALASVAKLLISPQWLTDHGLARYAKPNGHDFNFIADDTDVDKVRKIFEIGNGSMAEETDTTAAPEVVLYRSL